MLIAISRVRCIARAITFTYFTKAFSSMYSRRDLYLWVMPFMP